MKVELLNKSEYYKLETFLKKIPHSLVYYSTIYKDFLEAFLEEKSFYFILKENDEIVAMLPSMLKVNKRYGNVLNSLPFYGSNGGVISISNSEEVNRILIQAFSQFAIENNCISSTIITSPFEDMIDWYEENVDYTFKDQRVGQITRMSDNKEDLMSIYHYKTRNTVRKSLNGLKKIDYKNGLDYLDFIIDTHKENLTAINGLYKPRSFFEEVVRKFKYNENLRIYIGFGENDQPISGLLNLYYNKTVEYFSPVTVSTYRELQPLSGLIYQAMEDAISNGYQWWNWGGTWLSQGGVYQFKSRWGTADHNYYYYTKIYDNSVLTLSPEVLLSEYPYFFVLPFSELTVNKLD